MRNLVAATLWIYFGWYATSLVAEYAPIPSFTGAVVVAAVMAVQLMQSKASARTTLDERVTARALTRQG